tara:strand:+ start:17856 stop:18722 length:867 start_codon:yes stop_codon:yes gene_type:complete
MANEIEKTVDVELNDGTKIQIIVRKPSNAVLSAAQRKGALVWTQCIQEGVMTKKELEKVLEDRGIWTKAKAEEQAKILKEISDLEKKLYLSRGVTLKTSEGKKIAIQMRRKRIELRDLLAEKVALEQNTAESLSDNAKFDYIVSQCTFDINELPVYNSIDDYSNRSDDPIAFAAASALATMLYSLDKDFEMKLPENKFLAKFDYINDDLHLVNKEGNKVDTEGRLVNDLGQFINEEGKRVDVDGNLLDEDGSYIPTTEFEVDDKPKPKTRRRSTKKKETTETADSTDS